MRLNKPLASTERRRYMASIRRWSSTGRHSQFRSGCVW